jgi:diguanylate cyclase (GGDEF)-like protein
VLDTDSLRISFALEALVLLVLFLTITYRIGRSAYAAWWCASLVAFVVGAVAFLLSGTVHQAWAISLGNALIALGVGCVWAGARSLRQLALPWRLLLVAPAVVALATALSGPGDDVWAGGATFLAAMWIQFALAARELWRLVAESHAAQVDGGSYRASVWALAAMSSGAAVFYLGRWIAFLVVGPGEPPFTTVFGEAVTTLITTALLATVSFGMSTLSEEQQKAVLRDAAHRDALTGLLNRSGFVHHAEMALRAGRRHGTSGSLIMADLDHFKQVNDVHGHQAGDHAIVAFADSCRSAVRASDVVARHGGEEFVLLLPGADADRADEVARAISGEMARRSPLGDVVLPTVSFGIAPLEPTSSLERVIERADAALYRAKATGRNRAVHHAGDQHNVE